MHLNLAQGGEHDLVGGGERESDELFASDRESDEVEDSDRDDEDLIVHVDLLEGAPGWLNAFEELWRTPEVAADEVLQQDLQASGERFDYDLQRATMIC
jgi:hypothetical protein